ncbi:uncharacterized protein RMCB_6776 [Mycolicibacterium brisbanense]|uniref:Portal protein n=1 Tax=Mycolicibacterium brisbanense TaxID=146020 RepID=A0A100W6U3_9MYCO|nr:uncharacterized protein RMCB_6776 [Mycolicibacterium brisbanense]
MSAPTRELGYVNPYSGILSGWTEWDTFEQVPELLWPSSVRTYTRMSREDGRIASILAAVGLPIRRTAWRIDKAGASDEVTEFVARDLGLPIRGASDDEMDTSRTRGRFSWAEHLQQALLMLTFGHSVFEQVYDTVTDPGRAHLKKLAPRPSSTIAYWDVARDGGLVGVQQFPEGGMGGAAGGVVYAGRFGDLIPVNRLVVYTRDRDPGVWTGNSLLRPAYKHWLLKDELIRIEATAARRNGVGVPVVTAPEGVSTGEVSWDALAPYLKIARQFRGGNNAGVALPNGAELDIKGVQGTLPSGFIRQAIEYHDKQMALAALAHFLNLDKGGSYALASVQADAFTQSVQTIAELIRDIAQAHIVEDLVDLNFGPDEPAPRLTVDEIGSRQDATAAALQMLVTAGLLTPDSRLEAFERQTLGLPSADPDEATDEPDEAPAETAAPETAAPPVPETNVTNARTRGRTPRARIEPNGALTLW